MVNLEVCFSELYIYTVPYLKQGKLILCLYDKMIKSMVIKLIWPKTVIGKPFHEPIILFTIINIYFKFGGKQVTLFTYSSNVF